MLGFQLVAAISGVQAARLLETSPKGWQSSGSLEDKNYSKLQLSIQTLDYCPILDFHYKLLAKSEYNIEKSYNCTFQPIDIPTEKERAEIKEINSRCDLNYVQAGVISPDEVRGVLREDNNSGYNALAEEMEGEAQDPFSDFGGSSNEQSPFKSEAEVKDGLMKSGCNRTKPPFQIFDLSGEKSLDGWNESEHPRKDNGQFGAGSGSVEKSAKRDKIKEKQREEIQLPEDEYAQVMHELNTNLTKEQRKKKIITKSIGDYKYTVLNKGFNEYRIINKRKI